MEGDQKKVIDGISFLAKYALKKAEIVDGVAIIPKKHIFIGGEAELKALGGAAAVSEQAAVAVGSGLLNIGQMNYIPSGKVVDSSLNILTFSGSHTHVIGDPLFKMGYDCVGRFVKYFIKITGVDENNKFELVGNDWQHTVIATPEQGETVTVVGSLYDIYQIWSRGCTYELFFKSFALSDKPAAVAAGSQTYSNLGFLIPIPDDKKLDHSLDYMPNHLMEYDGADPEAIKSITVSGQGMYSKVFLNLESVNDYCTLEMMTTVGKRFQIIKRIPKGEKLRICFESAECYQLNIYGFAYVGESMRIRLKDKAIVEAAPVEVNFPATQAVSIAEPITVNPQTIVLNNLSLSYHNQSEWEKATGTGIAGKPYYGESASVFPLYDVLEFLNAGETVNPQIVGTIENNADVLKTIDFNALLDPTKVDAEGKLDYIGNGINVYTIMIPPHEKVYINITDYLHATQINGFGIDCIFKGFIRYNRMKKRV